MNESFGVWNSIYRSWEEVKCDYKVTYIPGLGKDCIKISQTISKN